jgi:hypothetical protein
VIEQTEKFIRRFCILPEAAYLPLATWGVATHLSDVYDAFPYLALLSPVKGCGKTRVLEVLELLCAKPLRVTTPSPASLFRMMEDSPTLFLDEVEFLSNTKPSEATQAIIAILNAGHRKGATVPRCEPPNWDVRQFRVYGPKAFAAIGGLPDTVADRSICVTVQRKAKTETVARFLLSKTPIEAKPIHAAVVIWAESNQGAVRAKYCEIEDLDFLSDREADLWMPIFAACGVSAPERLDELKQCALRLSGTKAAEDVEESRALKLLSDVRLVWPDGDTNVLTASLLEALRGIPDGPWGEAGHELTPLGLAKMLRPFGPEPRQVRVNSKTTRKGYRREDFDQAFWRYLPSAGAESETCETTRVDLGKDVRFESETDGLCFALKNASKPA